MRRMDLDFRETGDRPLETRESALREAAQMWKRVKAASSFFSLRKFCEWMDSRFLSLKDLEIEEEYHCLEARYLPELINMLARDERANPGTRSRDLLYLLRDNNLKASDFGLDYEELCQSLYLNHQLYYGQSDLPGAQRLQQHFGGRFENMRGAHIMLLDQRESLPGEVARSADKAELSRFLEDIGAAVFNVVSEKKFGKAYHEYPVNPSHPHILIFLPDESFDAVYGEAVVDEKDRKDPERLSDVMANWQKEIGRVLKEGGVYIPGYLHAQKLRRDGRLMNG